MTQQEFSDQIVAIANRIASTWEYSYTRQGFKYNPRDPERFLDADERKRVEQLQAQMRQLTIDFMETK
mgnify:CR=1 FL=1